MPVRDDLYRMLDTWDLELPADLNDQTPLFETGLLDSAGLFNLMLWVEEQVGHPIDPARFDLSREWATIGAIVEFMAGEQAGAPRGSAQPPPVGPLQEDRRYRIVEYQPGLKTGIAQLQTGLWSGDVDLNARYLEWKYERNPYSGGEPNIYVALDGDVVVGMRGFWESAWEIGPNIVSLPVADDLMIGSEHRNRGLNTRIMERATTGLGAAGRTHVISLNASPMNTLASLAMGWTSIGALQPMHRHSSGSRLRKRVRARLQQTPYLWKFADAKLPFSRAGRRSFEGFDAEPPRIPEMLELIERLPRDGRIRHVRDREYLSWRYANPLKEYRFIYSGAGPLDGYIALSRSVSSPHAHDVISVADLEASSDAVLVRLLAAAAERVEPLELWTAGMSTALRAALRDLGFVPAGGERGLQGYPGILIKPLADDASWTIQGESIADIAAWDMRMLYSMRA